MTMRVRILQSAPCGALHHPFHIQNAISMPIRALVNSTSGPVSACITSSTSFLGSKRPNSLSHTLLRSRFPRSSSLHTTTPVCSSSKQGSQDTPVRFTITKEVSYGVNIAIIGDHKSLGRWKADKAPKLKWTDGHVWTLDLALPAGETINFKCIQIPGQGEVSWEEGDNRILTLPPAGTASALTVDLNWSGPMEVHQQTEQGGPLTAVSLPSLDGSSSDSLDTEQSRENGSSSNAVYNESMSMTSDDESAGITWAGKDVVFMRSNDHTRERQGTWDTTGLTGAALDLVKGDKNAGNWLNKLELTKKLLVDDAPRMRPESDTLACVYVYLTWVATGALACVESGGHHRPNHHANIAKSAFRSLEWVTEDRAGQSDALVARRIQTKLPAFTGAFTQSVPLTRIRDIAHRGDIPHDLKQEIKHTIQNKLHRNAGPEDLLATELLLNRVTANPGEYSEAFISELRIFLAELRDFFNAGSLSSMLDEIRPVLDEASCQLFDHFLNTKNTLDTAGVGADQNMVMDALHSTTGLRALMAAGLASGLRNDAPDGALVMRQRWRLTEIRAEDYAFVLLSRFINSVEQRGGAGALGGGSDGAWALPIGALVIGLRHLGLSGFNPSECMAIENDLAMWQKFGGFQHRDEALRMRATLQRLRRLTESYSQHLLDLFSERALAMGSSLGIPTDMAAVFAESEIRSSIAFQLSKLSTLLLKATAIVAGGAEWDVLVTGRAAGVLLEAARLEPGVLDAAGDQDVVLLVDEASGDEEVGSLGPRLKAVLLKHEVPHLSHLGVRARQEQVLFACCEEESVVERTLRGLVGKTVYLDASPEGGLTIEDAAHSAHSIAHFTAAAPSSSNGATSTAGQAGKGAESSWSQREPDVKATAFVLVPVEEAERATCGAKAASCGELLRLSQGAAKLAAAGQAGNGAAKSTLFKAAEGVCLPYGCMEVALKEQGKGKEMADILTAAEAAMAASQGSASPALDALCADAAALISSLTVPQWVLQQVAGYFNPGQTVIARSSANVEDLEELSGAGLYDSIPNVDPTDSQALQAAITAVWASLFSRRALLARKAAGVPQGAACMAVLIQKQLPADLSFVLHTVHPLTQDTNTLVAELAPGLGETLASGTRGSAWRFQVPKDGSGKVQMLAFANFSESLLPRGTASQPATPSYVPPARYTSVGSSGSMSSLDELKSSPQALPPFQTQVVQYGKQEMSCSEEFRAAVADRLAQVGKLLEREFGGPQDVEGCVVDGQVYVVQTRPQM